jgi:hypothetical protein
VEDVQALLPKTSGAQLLKTLTQLVQVGAIRSAKQQQALDQLLQHLGQHLLDADVLLQLPDLISSLTEAETAQSQPGLGALIRKLAAVLECKDTALAEAPPAVALRMVAGLQQEPGQLQHVQQELLPGLPAKLLASIRELSAAVTAATAAAAAAAAALADADRGAGQAVAVQEVMRLEQQQKQLMQVLSLRERVSVVEAVKQFGGNTAGTASILMPAGGEEVALLLQAMIDSEVLQYRLQQQQEPADTPAQQAGGSDGGAAAAAALLPLPMVFVTEDWQQLARLLSMCLEWFPLDLLPLPLLQLVFEVGGSLAHGSRGIQQLCRGWATPAGWQSSVTTCVRSTTHPCAACCCCCCYYRCCCCHCGALNRCWRPRQPSAA